MLRLLLENYATVNYYGDKTNLDSINDYTCDEPLRLAIKNSHFECAEMLLKVCYWALLSIYKIPLFFFQFQSEKFRKDEISSRIFILGNFQIIKNWYISGWCQS